jgi:RNase P subunit RPR2
MVYLALPHTIDWSLEVDEQGRCLWLCCHECGEWARFPADAESDAEAWGRTHECPERGAK